MNREAGIAEQSPKELLQVFRSHWSVENSLHHVDRSWDEHVHTLRRPGLGEVYGLGQHRVNATDAGMAVVARSLLGQSVSLADGGVQVYGTVGSLSNRPGESPGPAPACHARASNWRLTRSS